MASTGDIARNIYRAARAIAHTGAEISAVSKELSEILLNEKEYNIKAADKDEGTEDDPHDWICTAYFCRYLFRARGRGIGKPLGQLTYIYDLGRDGGISNCLGQASVAVAWSMATDAPWEIQHITLPCPSRWDGDGHPGRYELALDHLALGLEGSSHRNTKLQNISWWYAFPLDALRRTEDIRRLMVDPVLSYLNQKYPDALTEADRPPEVIRLTIKDGLLQPNN